MSSPTTPLKIKFSKSSPLHITKTPIPNEPRYIQQSPHSPLFPIEINESPIVKASSISPNVSLNAPHQNNEFSPINPLLQTSNEDSISLYDSEDETSTLMENKILASSPPDEEVLLYNKNFNINKKSSFSSIISNSNFIKEQLQDIEDLHYKLNNNFNYLENEILLIKIQNNEIEDSIVRLNYSQTNLLNKIECLSNELHSHLPTSKIHKVYDKDNTNSTTTYDNQKFNLINTKLSEKDEEIYFKLKLNPKEVSNTVKSSQNLDIPIIMSEIETTNNATAYSFELINTEHPIIQLDNQGQNNLPHLEDKNLKITKEIELDTTSVVDIGKIDKIVHKKDIEDNYRSLSNLNSSSSSHRVSKVDSIKDNKSNLEETEINNVKHGYPTSITTKSNTTNDAMKIIFSALLLILLSYYIRSKLI
ncbi:hypothetical protein KGF54_001990 [Candida jiufengensis]|uniref:uncharacterized protein n=1 Tax=Candida jiufengensis TaxID=497108 RepID=UPI002224F06E|nr:uncharacterized protein KGF54_001990 [Candida jiufengensis]KAI5954215.1 hypothetical protein KGF54_001990 [Candida jiufengensis]